MVHEIDNPPEFVGLTAFRLSPNSSFSGLTKKDIEQSIPSRFEQIVARCPLRIAVKLDGQALTYDTLNRMANRIAHGLRSFCGDSKAPVALLAKNNVNTIAAILGIAKTGKIYVPLDSSFSSKWANSILDDTRAKIVLGGKDELSLAMSWVNSKHDLIEIDSLCHTGNDGNPNIEISPGALSQILYTSGTTGTPKGVMDTHRNMLHYVMRLGNVMHISPDDRITLVRPPHSAGALSNLYLALLSGATIFPVDLKQVSLASLAAWLRREKITILHASGTVFRHLAEQLTGAEKFPDLRLIRLASGQVYRQDVELFKRHFPDAVLLHVLSSTETNTYRIHFVDKDSEIPEDVLPAGYPVDDMEVLILDDSRIALGINKPGEIAVRSDYIFPGYWNNLALTNSAFLDSSEGDGRKVFCTGDLGKLRSDGCLEYLGRKDFQLKIRGYRIQAEEVELALLRLPGIREAAVTAHKNSAGDDQLVAYISLATSECPSISNMREALRQSVPEYMVPNKFVILKRLPLNPNGKVNRQKLPPPDLNEPPVAADNCAPRTPIELALATIWSRALGKMNIGIHEPFCDLGGDSIIASKIISVIGRIFPWQIALPDFNSAGTIAKMAQLLTQKAVNPDSAQTVASLYLQIDGMSSDEVEKRLTDERKKRAIQETTLHSDKRLLP